MPSRRMSGMKSSRVLGFAIARQHRRVPRHGQDDNTGDCIRRIRKGAYGQEGRRIAGVCRRAIRTRQKRHVKRHCKPQGNSSGASEGQRQLPGGQRWRSGERAQHRVGQGLAVGVDGADVTDRRRVGGVAFAGRRENVGVNRRAAGAVRGSGRCDQRLSCAHGVPEHTVADATNARSLTPMPTRPGSDKRCRAMQL